MSTWNPGPGPTSGNDTFYGDNGVDVVNGGGGHDTLYGGGGNDQLRGGAGNDVLQGGAGQDMMWGDAGADRFVWTTVAEAAADSIFGFETGKDVLDLSAIDADTTTAGNQAFEIVSAFSGQPGELMLVTMPYGAGTVVYLDVNGDGVADGSFMLAGPVAVAPRISRSEGGVRQVNSTRTPGSTAPASSSTSQLVRRTQPCEAVLPTSAGSGVPWMP